MTSSWRAFFVVLVVCCACVSGRGADYYVHASLGVDNSPGSESQPWRSLAKLSQVMASGDRAFLAGEFRERLYLAGLSNITVAQWPGEPQAVLRGDRIISGVWSGGAGIWSTVIAPGKTPSAVVVDWDTSIDQHGRHFGFLVKMPDLASVLENPNSFCFDDAVDTLTVNLDGDDPESHQIAYCEKGLDGLTIHGGPSGVTNVVVDGIHSYLWGDPTPGSGYGIKMRDCRNSILRNHVAIDNGYHGTGWVNYSVPNTNNIEENGVVWGANNDSCYVFYTGVGDVTGARWSDCIAYKYTFLGRDGKPFAGARCVAFAAHTSNTGPLVRDVLAERCRVVEYDDTNLGAAFTCQGTSSPSDERVWQTYPVRIVECTVLGGKANYIYPSSIAFVRCRLDYSNSGAYSGTGEAVFSDNAVAGSGAVLFDACEIVANLDGPASRAFFGVRGQMRWSFLNSSFLDSGVNSFAHRLFMWYNPQAGLLSRGSIFAFRNRAGTRWFGYNDNNAAWLPLHDFRDCVYANVSDTAYSTVTGGAYNDKGEWKSLVDPEGMYLTDVPYADPSGASGLGLDPHGPLAGVRKRVSIATSLGINGVMYAGNYGAYQYLCPSDFDGNGFVNALDYDQFSGVFEEGGPEADINADGFVNALDYDQFASAFEEGC
ncbi:MAG: hypothetical protein IT432_15360 [Phycisphaerales bacterium]|nr:hypothetical protein [Phycisphaerales bacterium]